MFRAEGVMKDFPGTRALKGVSMDVRVHEVVGLVGENGSGKSTLLRIAAGVLRPDSGKLFLRGKRVSFNSARDALRQGIGMVFQEQSLIPGLTVAENIFFGAETAAVRHGVYHWRQLYREAKEALSLLGLDVNPHSITESLTFAEQQKVEIVKVMQTTRAGGGEPLVILDEPTAVLDGRDVEMLLEQVRRLREVGSVIFVSHRVDEVLSVADRVYVLRDGDCVFECDAGGTSRDDLVKEMVGREVVAARYGASQSALVNDGAPPLLEARSVKSGICKSGSLRVHKGEVVGIAGVVGSGKEDLCRALFGAAELGGGEIVLEGRRARFRSPADAAKAGIGYVPSNRRVEGIASGLDVAENIVLAAPREACWGPVLSSKRWGELVKHWIKQLRIITSGLHAPVEHLSGGNQQKVVLAKWLAKSGLRVLILDHPARGLDIGAKEEVYRAIRQLASRGMGIVLLADTLDELIALSDTVVVMRDGIVSGHWDGRQGKKPSEAEVTGLMV